MELPDPVRQRLGNFSLTVFGDSSRTGPESSEAAGLKASGPPPQTAETVGMPVQLPTDTDAGDSYGFHGSQNNFSQPPKREKSQDR